MTTTRSVCASAARYAVMPALPAPMTATSTSMRFIVSLLFAGPGVAPCVRGELLLPPHGMTETSSSARRARRADEHGLPCACNATAASATTSAQQRYDRPQQPEDPILNENC